MSAHPPTLVLERRLRHEPPGEGAHWATHLESCADCAARLREMEREDLAYEQSARARALAAALQGLSASRTPMSRRITRLLLPVLLPSAFAALALLWWRGTAERGLHDEQFRTKGSGIEVTLERGTTTADWDGSPLREGDAVQFAVSASRTEQLALFLRAGKEILQLYPEAGDGSQRSPVGAHQPLGGSVRVDGHSVSVFLYSSDGPFELSPLRAALAAGRTPRFSGSQRTLELPGASGP